MIGVTNPWMLIILNFGKIIDQICRSREFNSSFWTKIFDFTPVQDIYIFIKTKSYTIFFSTSLLKINRWLYLSNITIIRYKLKNNLIQTHSFYFQYNSYFKKLKNEF